MIIRQGWHYSANPWWAIPKFKPAVFCPGVRRGKDGWCKGNCQMKLIGHGRLFTAYHRNLGIGLPHILGFKTL